MLRLSNLSCLIAMLLSIGASAGIAENRPPGNASQGKQPQLHSSNVRTFEGGDICAALLNQGIRDVQSANISESRFNEVRSQVCNANYDSYSKAQSQSASGAIDVPGYFGVSASDANAAAEYSTKWSTFAPQTTQRLHLTPRYEPS